MPDKLDIFRKKLLYRASYRGTKEMDILLSSFVKKYIHGFDQDKLYELEKFLDFEDEVIAKFYNFNISNKNIDQNDISKIFKNFKI